MKVLQINKYPSLKGGTETVLFSSIRLLEERGHQVILLSTDEGEVIYKPTYTISYPRADSTLFQKIKSLPDFFYNYSAVDKLESIIAKEKPDIAHIHLYQNSFSNSILPILKKYGIPIVMTLHEYRQICPSYLMLDKELQVCEKCKGHTYFHCMFSKCAKGSLMESTLLTLEMYYRRIFLKTEKYVDRFICPSKFVYEKHKTFNKNIANKAQVIYNPIALEDARIHRGDYLLYIGRLSKEKGIDTLFKAMELLPHVKLKVVGSGNLVFSDIPSNVELLGFKSDHELDELVRNALYTVVPSEWYETFGMSIVESLNKGTPVIASNIGAIPEILKNEDNGFLFEAKNVESLVTTIKTALSLSDQDYANMAERGKQRILRFSEDNYIDNLLDVYSELLRK